MNVQELDDDIQVQNKMRLLVLIVFLTIAGSVLHAQSNLDSLLVMWEDESQPDSTRVSAYCDYIWDGFLFSDPDSAFTLAQGLLEFSEESSDRGAKAQALRLQGVSWYMRGDYAKALEFYTLCLEIEEEIGNKRNISKILNNIGNVHWGYGEYQQALDFYTRSLELDEELGDQSGVAGSLLNVGNVHNELGNYDEALDCYSRSLALNEDLGDKAKMAMALNNIGTIYEAQDTYLQALTYYSQSLTINEEIGDEYGIAYSLTGIGAIYSEQGYYDKALDHYSQCLAIDEKLGDPVGIANSLGNIATVYQAQGFLPKALEHFNRCLKIYEELGDPGGIANSLGNIGSIHNEQGDHAVAFEAYARSLKLYEELGERSGEARLLHQIGFNQKDQGNLQEALLSCEKSLEVSAEIGTFENDKLACECLFLTYKALGNESQALQYLELMRVAEDSLAAGDTDRKLQEMEFNKAMLADSLRQEEEKFKVELEHQQEVSEKDRTRNMLFSGALLLLVVAIALFARVRYVRKANVRINTEKDRSESLLLNILPAEIAEELKEKGEADARDFDTVSILFTDFKGFTQASEKLSASDLVAEINTCFKAFDAIVEKYGIEKIKTIGDAYMCAGGLPIPDDEATVNTVLAGLEMQEFMKDRKKTRDVKGLPAFEMRVGIHTGSVVAGIVGVKKFQYDIWGDTVNTASRMESSGEVGKVNISQACYDLLKTDSQFDFIHRGKIDAKGKGAMEMWFIALKNT